MKKLLFAIIVIPFVIISCDQKKDKENESKNYKDTVGIETNEQSFEWNHVVNWFEIPVIDFERATKFYETILDIKMPIMIDSTDLENGPYSMAFFSDPEKVDIVSGAIVKSNFCKPNTEGGITVYLNANPDLTVVLNKIESAGGKITMQKTPIGENHEHGFMAMFIDTEGNVMALHSIN